MNFHDNHYLLLDGNISVRINDTVVDRSSSYKQLDLGVIIEIHKVSSLCFYFVRFHFCLLLFP